MARAKSSKLKDPPLWLKIFYSAFVAVMIPTYWHITGPINFLWFSDLALFLTVVSLWKRSPLLNSMMFLSVVLFESIWIVDVGYQMISGSTLVGLAAYMFDPTELLVIKWFSGIFHILMPATIVYLIYLWGYDRRAVWRQCIFAACVLIITYVAHPTENINWARGLFGKEGNTYGLPSVLYLALLIVAYSVIIYIPVNFVMAKFVRPAPKA